MARLPRIPKNLNLFVDGFGKAGWIDTLNYPNLALVTAEHRAGGMDAAVDYDMGMEKLDLGFVLSDPDEQVFSVLGRPGIRYIARSAIQRPEEPAEALIVTMTGMLKQANMGEQTPGEKQTIDLMANLTYYKLQVNGEVVVEIDIPNMVRNIGGEDQLAAQRAALGL
ncbi:phage major tail tube protein [Cyanobium sp. N5-Cardenillas]|uniref:phage major tail tube protein n=1 Tax=Cyanobium sp. N5-Cardenillas TaxID=2823720 RepID=UPI0020CC93CC|nr:phage major tail tube protein [Cyanobium sp. N5-Cardenillas]MCP9785399.1 phage major tail tube protein [Cyanobium sp. N5-Cardenillas]